MWYESLVHGRLHADYERSGEGNANCLVYRCQDGLKSLLDGVAGDADVAIITRRDAEDAVVMSLDYYNSLMETVYLLKSPANAAHLSHSIAQFRAGEVVEQDTVGEQP